MGTIWGTTQRYGGIAKPHPAGMQGFKDPGTN